MTYFCHGYITNDVILIPCEVDALRILIIRAEAFMSATSHLHLLSNFDFARMSSPINTPTTSMM